MGGNEGDEGLSHDGKCSVRRGCGGPVEKERLVQTRRRVEPEAQEKASDASPKGCEPIHKRAMRFQSQASIENRQGLADEEVQGDDQLDGVLGVRVRINVYSKRFRVSVAAMVGGLTGSFARALY